MPTPPSSGVALRCAESWYESLHTAFASCREIPHLPLPFRSGQGGLNSSLMKGLTALSSLLPPKGTKPGCDGLIAKADARGLVAPTGLME